MTEDDWKAQNIAWAWTTVVTAIAVAIAYFSGVDMSKPLVEIFTCQ